MIEYDVSGGDSSKQNVTNIITNDWNNKVKKYTLSKQYIHQDGKPAVMIFGIGFANKKTSPRDGLLLVNTLKKQNAHVSLGVPTQWSDMVNKNDTYAEVFKAANIVSPWTVGAYNRANFAKYNTKQKSDVQYVTTTNSTLLCTNR